MPIAMTDEQRALHHTVREWAAKADPVHWPDLVHLGFFDVTREGGTIVDLAVMIEAAAEHLVPGPLLTTALAGVLLARDPLGDEIAAGRVTVGFGFDADHVISAGEATHLLVNTDRWVLVPADQTTILRRDAVDFSRTLGKVELQAHGDVMTDPTDLALTLMAAEASGVAAVCLKIATDYAKQREQFGRPIGSFQAVKHLCVEMLCRAEQASAVAWDAARAADEAPEEHALATAVAAAIALDAAVENAKDCIQVLGGIGFTWEHDAHRYLRRALALRQHAGGSAKWRRRAAELALEGKRRSLAIQLDDDPEIRQTVERIAQADEQRKALADSGYLVPHWPKPYGLDATPKQQLTIDDELAKADVTRPDLVIGGWAAPTILNHGSPEQQERFVRPTLRGEITWCQLFSEPEAGSDLASLRTKAIRTDGGWLLSGQKVWTSLAREADWAICLARTDPDVPKHKGITYFLVDMRTNGIDIRPIREITGDARFNEVFLDNVFVPDDCVVGDVNGGWRLARTTLANERVAMGRGSSLGESLERILELDAATDPDTRERLGALVADGQAGSLLDLRTSLKRLSGQDPGAESSVRKLVGVRHRQTVAEFGVELLGPGATVQNPVIHEFLLGRCLSIAGGTTQVLLNLAGERILGLPRES